MEFSLICYCYKTATNKKITNSVSKHETTSAVAVRHRSSGEL